MSDSTESPNAGYIDRLLRLATIEASKFIAEAQRFVGPPLFLADDGTFALAPPAAVNSYTCVDYYARLGVPYPVYLRTCARAGILARSVDHYSSRRLYWAAVDCARSSIVRERGSNHAAEHDTVTHYARLAVEPLITLQPAHGGDK
jgi:hypothetical protein